MSCWIWAKMQMTFRTLSCFQNFIKHCNPDFLSHSGFLCQLTVILKRTSLSTQQGRVPNGCLIAGSRIARGSSPLLWQVGRVGRFPFFVLDVFVVHLVKFHSIILKQLLCKFLDSSAEPCLSSVLCSCLGKLDWKSRVPIPRIEPGAAWCPLLLQHDSFNSLTTVYCTWTLIVVGKLNGKNLADEWFDPATSR